MSRNIKTLLKQDHFINILINDNFQVHIKRNDIGYSVDLYENENLLDSCIAYDEDFGLSKNEKQQAKILYYEMLYALKKICEHSSLKLEEVENTMLQISSNLRKNKNVIIQNEHIDEVNSELEFYYSSNINTTLPIKLYCSICVEKDERTGLYNCFINKDIEVHTRNNEFSLNEIFD